MKPLNVLSDYFFQNLLHAACLMTRAVMGSFLHIPGFSFLLQNSLGPHAGPGCTHTQLLLLCDSRSSVFGVVLELCLYSFYLLSLFLYVVLDSLTIKF